MIKRAADIEKLQPTDLVAHPIFPGTGLQIKFLFELHLGLRIGWRQNFNADFRRNGTTEFMLDDREGFFRGPGDVRHFGRVFGFDGAFGDRFPARQQGFERVGDFAREIAVEITRGAHDDLSRPVQLDLVRQVSQILVIA